MEGGAPDAADRDGGRERARAGGRPQLVLVAAAVAALATIGAGQLAEGSEGPTRLAWTAIANACLMGGLAVMGALAMRSGPRRALRLSRPADRVGWPLVALLALGCLGLSHLLDAAARHMAIHEASQLGAIESTLRVAEPPSLPLLLVGLSLAPGIAEELLFRGLLLGLLARWLGVPAALLLCSALFGAIHMDVVQGIGAAVLGLYLGAVVVVTGSLYAAIVCHVLNNALAVGLAMAGAAGLALSPRHLLVSAALATTIACWPLARRWPEAQRKFLQAGDRQAAG